MSAATGDAGSAGVRTTLSESPRAVKIVLLGVFINRVGGFLNIFLVLFLTAEGYSPGQTATAIGVYGAGSVISVLIGGVLSARLGVRTTTVISMGSCAALTAALLYLPNYAMVLCSVALLGTVSQIFWPASATLLSELTPASRQVMILAMYRFAVNLGSTAAPLIGFALYELGHGHYTLLFWGEALLALAYAVLAHAVLPRRSRAEVGPDTAEVTGLASGYLQVLRDRRYTVYLIAAFFYTAVYMQYLSTLPLDVKSSGLPVFWYTLAVSLNGLIVILFELPLTNISQHWPRRVTVCVAFTLVGVGMATYGLPLGPAVIVIGTLIWTFAEIIGAPVVFAYPGMAGPAHLKSHYIGSFQFAFGLGSAGGKMAGVALFGVLGHLVWPVVALGSVLSVVCAAVALRPLPESAERTPDATRSVSA